MRVVVTLQRETQLDVGGLNIAVLRREEDLVDALIRQIEDEIGRQRKAGWSRSDRVPTSDASSNHIATKSHPRLPLISAESSAVVTDPDGTPPAGTELYGRTWH